MAQQPHHGGTVVILGGPSPMGVGGGSKGPGSKGTIPLPKSFDVGDLQPGDPIDVTAHCKLSEDGKSLEVQSIDDADPSGDADDDADQTAGAQDDGSADSADDWQGMMDRKSQGG